MDDTEHELICTHCGQRVGVYEPLMISLPDGSVVASSYLNLTPHERHVRPQVWHADCFVRLQE